MTNKKLKKLKYFSYILGSSYEDIKKQIIMNSHIVYQDENIKFDNQNKKILIKNINTLLNTRVTFAKSYFKVAPGIGKLRDIWYINVNIYFKFVKNKNKYELNSFMKFFSFGI
ncbi:MAG: hypothetical protein Q8888_00190 [Vigna little leaf phytoplasma]|nr:hypothetical protein [Vigna little leaf phytoplasma]